MLTATLHLLPARDYAAVVGLRDRMEHLVRGGAACLVCECLAGRPSDQIALYAQRSPVQPSELSGGEQQRVCVHRAARLREPHAFGLIAAVRPLMLVCASRTIARALANEPEIMLLDEPTGDLDTRNTVDIMDLLLDINLTKRTTFLMVTHNPDIECYADRCLYLEDGRIKRQAINAKQMRLDYDQYIGTRQSAAERSRRASAPNRRAQLCLAAHARASLFECLAGHAGDAGPLTLPYIQSNLYRTL